ncbi:MAG: hypothetical protein DRI28_00025 [Caldiserica bacterium]|nr:MAG: hypothetical protein DRI28_00025 [Caldisericota bacterium]
MAIEKIKEVYLFSLKRDFPFFFDFLKKEGKLHIDSVRDINGLSVFRDVNVSKFDKEISELETIINELEKFGEKKSLIKSFIPERIELKEEEFNKIVKEFDYKSVYNRVLDYIKEEERILDRIKNIKKLLTSLLPYSSFELELENLDKLKTIKLVLGSLEKKYLLTLDRMKEKLIVKIVSSHRNKVFLFLGYKRDDREVEEFLRKIEFSPLDVSGLTGKIKDVIENINKDLEKLVKDRERIIEKKRKEAKNLKNIIILREYYLDKRREEEIKQRLIESKFFVFIRGWIKERDIRDFRDRVEERFKDVIVEFHEPKNLEEVPVALRNPKFIKPFELLTGMYGFPKYHDFDPTPYFTPLFILFFSLCFGDVIYGSLLLLGSYLFIKLFKIHEKDRGFFYFFMILGFFSIIVGVLTNSWAGDLLSFPQLAVIDIIGDENGLLKMLIFALAVGFISQLFGIFLKGLNNIRHGKLLDAIFDQFSWISALSGIGVYILGSTFKSPALLNVGKFMIIGGVIIIVLTGGRESKSIFGKVIGGVVSLYGIVSSYGFSAALADILSYSRLLALGFSTTVLGIIMNTMARMFGKGIMLFILAPLILLAGHGLNFFMGILGAFVHPTRLIFLEFFGRFYENGGKRFKPFKFSSEKIILKKID